MTKLREPIRITVRLNFLDDERPLARQCSTTRLSTRCTNRVSCCFSCSALQRNVVRAARASSTLMCSFRPVHRQPDMTFHRHSPAGMLALNLWYRNGTSVLLWTMMSSPRNEVKPAILRTSTWLRGRVEVVRPKGGLISRLGRSPPFPGVNRSTICSKVTFSISPSIMSSWLSNHATTPTLQEFPSNVNRQSSCSCVPCSAFFKHWVVYPMGKPRIASRSLTLGVRTSPFCFTQCLSLYWYGANLCLSAFHRATSWGRQSRSPAGFLIGTADGREVVKVGSLSPTNVDPGSRKSTGSNWEWRTTSPCSGNRPSEPVRIVTPAASCSSQSHQ